ARKDITEAPRIETPVTEASLGAGAYAGAATSAITAVMEAAAMRTAQLIFFMSMTDDDDR
ncbi:hypothetical protein FRX31_029355, partial [Thalictrum thalictroides]